MAQPTNDQTDDTEAEPSDGTTTANPWVFSTYQELVIAPTVPAKVAALERLYRAGWDDALRALDEAANRADEDDEAERDDERSPWDRREREG